MQSKVIFGLFFVALVAGLSTSVFAADEAAAATAAVKDGSLKMWLAISAGFGIAIAATAGTISQSKAVVAALEGIARNPGAQGKIFVPMILGLALIESLVLFALIVALGLSGKI